MNGWSTFEEFKEWRIRSAPATYIIGADGKIIIAKPEQKIEDVMAPLLAK
jgi:hypothetical protein